MGAAENRLWRLWPRGYEGDYMFSWIGATTPIPHKVWEQFGNLGAACSSCNHPINQQNR
jgi:hypothetical protein